MVIFVGVMMVLCLSEDVLVLGRCKLKWLEMRNNDGRNLLSNDLTKGIVYLFIGMEQMLTVGKSRCAIHWYSLYCSLNFSLGL